ncbi:MAG: hypothetical protein ACK4VP_02210 [Nitrospira sp.]
MLQRIGQLATVTALSIICSATFQEWRAGADCYDGNNPCLLLVIITHASWHEWEMVICGVWEGCSVLVPLTLLTSPCWVAFRQPPSFSGWW